MHELPVDIVDFLHRRDLLSDTCHSVAQLACLKSVYGLPLSPEEMLVYQRGTGRHTYDATEQREITIIAGRRSGKTGKIAAPICCFEAFRDHGLPPGEEGHIMLLAPTLKQAGIAFRCIRNYLQNSKVLSKRIVRTTKMEIFLDNGVVIGCYPCTYDGVRGRTIIAAICDEVAFWGQEEDSVHSADEVFAALLPGMATVCHAKLVKISTPFEKNGILWREFRQRTELDFPVWQVGTREMNPSVNASVFERERKRSEEKFSREFEAKFTDSINAWITPEILEPCIVRDRHELPFLRGVRYAAALDPASRHNDFALAVLHILPDGMIVVDRVARWAGTKTAPLAYEQVLHNVSDILDEYQINTTIGDQYCYDAISQYLLKLGIIYKPSVFGAHTRARIFGNLKHVLVQQKIQVPDDPILLRQLRNLREEKNARGQIDVRPIGNGHDDIVVAVALGVTELIQEEPVSPFGLGIVERYGVRFIPVTCLFQAPCRNCPRCIDLGECQGLDLG